MTNWDAVRDVIRRDAQIRHLYIDGQGQTCIIGGLAEAAGVNVEEAVFIMEEYEEEDADGNVTGTEEEERDYNSEAIDDVPALHDPIEEFFGLTLWAQGELQDVNDKHEDADVRRIALLVRVDELEAFEEEGRKSTS